MYNGKTLENIQEFCKKVAEMENTKETFEDFSTLRKFYIEPDLMSILDNIDMVSEAPGHVDMAEIERILSTPSSIVEYQPIVDDYEDDVVELPRKKVIKAVPKPQEKNSFKGGKKMASTSKPKSGSDDLAEDEFLKEFDPTGKFIAMATSLIVSQSQTLNFDLIAGLKEAKRAIKESVVLPMLRPDIFTGLRAPAKGILLFGPPGTGKTFLAKVAASECQSTFFSVSASSMTSKWIGDSEKIVRALFAVAKAKQPSIIFIDEIDALLSMRSDDDKDNMRGLKTEFLVQLDGMASEVSDQILVIAATNRPQAIDEAARRRFTKRIYVGLPDKEAREHILKTQLKSASNVITAENIKTIVDATKKFSCSDVNELVRSAAAMGIRDKHDDLINASFIPPPISMSDFDLALKEVGTSVSDKGVSFHLAWNANFGSFKDVLIEE